jgi:hypothetical protein
LGWVTFVNVRVGWFKISIRMLGRIGACRGVWPRGVENGRWVAGWLSGRGSQQRGESFTLARQRGWLVEYDTANGAWGKVGRRRVSLDVSD